MAGWEELSPDQIVFLMGLVVLIVIIHHVFLLIRSLINLKISRNIKINVEKELIKEVQKEVQEQTDRFPFFNKIKLWWSKRKAQKELCKPFKPIKRRDFFG